jgi:hypothetical protein
MERISIVLSSGVRSSGLRDTILCVHATVVPMKPYRVKRGNKFIGSFIVVHEGKRVNLGTKDANEARRRQILIEKGMWPEPAGDAAAAVKQALEGKDTDEAENVVPAQAAAVEGGRAGNVGPGAVRPDDVPHRVDEAPQSGTPVAPAADAVNAAAAAEADALLSEAQTTLADAGIDFGEIKAKLPTLLASGHLWLQGQLCRAGVRVVKGRWPLMVTLPDDDPLRAMVGKLDAALLARLDLDVEKLGPGWFLLILSVVTSIAQVGGMLEALAAEEQAKVN